jgi:hypothetical protein
MDPDPKNPGEKVDYLMKDYWQEHQSLDHKEKFFGKVF